MGNDKSRGGTENRRWTRRQAIGAGALLFALALTLRLLFWQAAPDASSAYPAYYKGDTPTWLTYAQSLARSEAFEFGLPLRPPGVAYLLSILWDEDAGFSSLRLIWCLMGATVVVLIYAAALRSFGWRTAWIAGLLSAASTGLLILSTSPNNETPYLLLVVLGFVLWEPIRRRPRVHWLVLWGGLQAVACLVRVEHVLFFALVSVYLTWAWASDSRNGVRAGWKVGLRRTAVSVTVFAAALAPWHSRAWGAIERFNDQPLPTNAATEQMLQRLELALAPLTWREDALQERDKLPAFCRRNMANFVAATVALRGKNQVTAQDFAILEEAFGSRPESIESRPFLVLYGGLNFFLANNPDATGGFSRAPLEKAPPLEGGELRYPRSLILGLPPPQLTLSYPPHLEILNHGYRLGLAWIAGHPTQFLRLTAKKLRIFWAGASLGFTGYGLPLGLAGVRRVVDLATPEGGWVTILWRFALLALLVLGLWAGRREEGLVPWLLFLLMKVSVTIAFFGYAREGATVIPVLAVAAGLAVARWLPALRPATWVRLSAATAILLIAVESVRWIAAPQFTLDNRTVQAKDPFPPDQYQQRIFRVR